MVGLTAENRLFDVAPLDRPEARHRPPHQLDLLVPDRLGAHVAGRARRRLGEHLGAQRDDFAPATFERFAAAQLVDATPAHQQAAPGERPAFGSVELARPFPDAHERILHNNSVASLLAVDAAMLRGEILYREGKHEQAFTILRTAVEMQDNLNYDEPWGKMQPIRHALGGLLLEQGQSEEAEKVFRKDLFYHPKNPWALVGLLGCLRHQNGCCSPNGPTSDKDRASEISEIEEQLKVIRQGDYVDFEVLVACECCQRPE